MAQLVPLSKIILMREKDGCIILAALEFLYH